MNAQTETTTDEKITGTLPEITEDTAFEIRGFNTEPEAEQTGLSAEDADRIAAGITAGGATSPEVATPEPKAEAKIKIGDREFADTQEAWAYAQELEREKLAADAFRHGIETASRAAPGNPPPRPEEPTEIDPLFYTDPQAYHKKLAAELKQQVLSEVDQVQVKKQRNDETWKQFYQDYPDLAKSGVLVQVALDHNWERLKLVNTNIALKEIAQMARAMKKEITDADAPGQELPRVGSTASPGNGTQVTRKVPEERALSFVEQFRNINKKRNAPPRR